MDTMITLQDEMKIVLRMDRRGKGQEMRSETRSVSEKMERSRRKEKTIWRENGSWSKKRKRTVRVDGECRPLPLARHQQQSQKGEAVPH